LTQNDPTDHALAAIASILDHKEVSAAKEPERETVHGVDSDVAEMHGPQAPMSESTGIPEAFHFAETTHVTQTIHVSETVTIVSETTTVVSENDHETDFEIHEHDAPATAPEAIEHVSTDVDSYSRSGPGPLDAIRFRWTARRDDNGDYFVDETIGTSSRPIASGPMPRHEVVAFIDDRERSARERFDALKSSMTLGHPFGSRRASEDIGEH
jgi:hypothetical protein